MNDTLLNIATSLSTLIYKDTVTAVTTKMETMKNEKDVDKLKNTYNEIINQILGEREEAIMIAQTYKQELDRVTISDEDIEYLQETISRVLEILNIYPTMEGDNDVKNINLDTANSLKGLISKDVLKTMQLLGFNYKEAIGDPLTKLCAEKIESLGERSRN